MAEELLTSLRKELEASQQKDHVVQKQQAEIAALTRRNSELESLLHDETENCRQYQQQCNIFEKQRLAAIDHSAHLQRIWETKSNASTANVPLRNSVPVSHDPVVQPSQSSGAFASTETETLQPSEGSSSPLSSPELLLDGIEAAVRPTSTGGDGSAQGKRDRAEDAAGHDEDTVQVAALHARKKARHATPEEAAGTHSVATSVVKTEKASGRKTISERLNEAILQNPRWGQEALNHAFFQEKQKGEWSDAKRREIIPLISRDRDFEEVLNLLFRTMLKRIVKGTRFTPYVETGDIKIVSQNLKSKSAVVSPITPEEMQSAEHALQQGNTKRATNPLARVCFDDSTGCVKIYNADPVVNGPELQSGAVAPPEMPLECLSPKATSKLPAESIDTVITATERPRRQSSVLQGNHAEGVDNMEVDQGAE